MSEDQHSAPHRRSSDEPAGVCALHELFEKTLAANIKEIKDNSKDAKEGVDRIESALNAGNVRFENLSLRMDHVEKLVYGAAGLALIAVASAVLGLVLKAGG